MIVICLISIHQGNVSGKDQMTLLDNKVKQFLRG